MTRVALAGLLIALAAGPTLAEGNRLLPFWGQPFPAGYAWQAGDPVGSLACRPGQRASIVRVAGGRHLRRCETVLHARD